MKGTILITFVTYNRFLMKKVMREICKTSTGYTIYDHELCDVSKVVYKAELNKDQFKNWLDADAIKLEV